MTHPVRRARMRSASLTTLAAVAALVAAPVASAADIQTGVASVQSHTTHASAALTRAVSLFQHGKTRGGSQQFAVSQKQLGIAAAAAQKLQAQAHTPAASARAAQAEIAVAKQDRTSVVKLSALVPDTSGKVQNAIAQAALSDVTAQNRAMNVIAAVEAHAPTQAQTGLADALEAISTATQSEASAAAHAATAAGDSTTSAGTLVTAVNTAVNGQDTASTELAALVASASTPPAALSGLERAYGEVSAQQGSIASILSHLSSQMPASVATFVSSIITQALTNASMMQANLPTPPSAPGAGSQPSGGGSGSEPSGGGTASQPPSGIPGSGSLTSTSGSQSTGSGSGSQPISSTTSSTPVSSTLGSSVPVTL